MERLDKIKEKSLNMKILICGVGAIGSNLVTSLVPDLKGEHEITILDKDNVEDRNITAGTQRYTLDQVGLPKVEALQFNIYKWFNRDINILKEEYHFSKNSEMVLDYDLILDCFDNNRSRETLQIIYSRIMKKVRINLLHIGFSDNFTFAIEWADNYKTPSDITSDFDICTLPGAAAFVASVASLGSLVAEEFINNEKKIEIVGGKFIHNLIQ